MDNIFTDSGKIANDIQEQIKQKSGNITIKLQNFLTKNHFSPFSVKIRVLNACLNASLIYGCESWSYASINSVNSLHQKAIKMILGVRNTVTNKEFGYKIQNQ